MSAARDVTSRLRQTVWNGSVPLEIRLHKGDCRTYDTSDPYLIQFPRLSYLGLLIHKLHGFFESSLIFPEVSPADAWLEYEGVPLRWHYPLGLLYDLYSGAEPAYPEDASGKQEQQTGNDEPKPLPWRLTVHFSDYPMDQLVKLDTEGKHLHDLYIHSVKEADYLRTGTGKTVMFLSKEDSTQLWESVKQHNFSLFNSINQKLLNPQGANLRHLPVRLYLPHAASPDATPAVKAEQISNPRDADTADKPKKEEKGIPPGSLRVVQSLITPSLTSRQPQTIGTALNQIIPTLFPSRRSPLLAQAVLHGAVLPLGANVEELIRATSYLDGWLHIAVVMMA